MDKADSAQAARIVLPVDAVVAHRVQAGRAARTATASMPCPRDAHDPRRRPAVGRRIQAAIDDAATLVWNGPLGAFEMPPFDSGTVAVARMPPR